MRKNLRVIFLVSALIFTILSFEVISQAGTGLVQGKVTRIMNDLSIEVLIGQKKEKIVFSGIKLGNQKEVNQFIAQKILGKVIYLEFDKNQRDKNGRLLSYVWLKDVVPKPENASGYMLNAILVSNGYAQVLNSSNTKYGNLFVSLQAKAKQSGKGLWGISGKQKSGSGAYRYVGNKNSKVFHHSNCRYVEKIDEGNKVFFNTREEAKEQGYRPCKICKP